MAVTAYMFTQFSNALAEKATALGTDPIRVIATTTATPITNYGAIQDTAATMAAVKAATAYAEVANAAGGSNYVQNANSHLSGLGLGAGTWARVGHIYTLTSATLIQWTTASAPFAPTSLLFFIDLGSDAANLPISYVDLGGAQPGTGGNWTYTLPATGIMQATST